MRWRAYVPQAARRSAATEQSRVAARRGEVWTPVLPETRGRKISRSVWGEAWCSNLERYHDYANRLPRGRTYLRNGSVVHLAIEPGRIEAYVNGSSLYRVRIEIDQLASARWKTIASGCSGDVGSLVELLEGRISAKVMAVMTAKGTGLFPEPREIKLDCSCPDWATMCKHVAAVMYGIGVRLDTAPELLFALRGVDPSELATRVPSVVLRGQDDDGVLATDDLAAVFGIEIADAPVPDPKPARASGGRRPAAKATKAPAVAPAKPAARKRPDARATDAGARRSAGRTGTVSRAELLALGVSAGTISGWVDRGLLLPTGRAGVYRRTAALAERLAARGLA